MPPDMVINLISYQQSFDRNPASRALAPPDEETVTYYAGGFNGGKTEVYEDGRDYRRECQRRLEEQYRIVATRTHMNRYLIQNPPTLDLDPTYCYAEEFIGQTILPTWEMILFENHSWRYDSERSSLYQPR